MQTVFIGSDHRGFNLKAEIKEALATEEYQIIDLGAKIYDQEDDYTDIAIKLAEKVIGEKAKGILICGSGVGVCIAANKVKGIRAALCTSEKQARLAREDDDANIICLSSGLIDTDQNISIIKTFLDSIFSSEERHIRRIQKIKKYETS